MCRQTHSQWAEGPFYLALIIGRLWFCFRAMILSCVDMMNTTMTHAEQRR
jgi:hypothetical protein